MVSLEEEEDSNAVVVEAVSVIEEEDLVEVAVVASNVVEVPHSVAPDEKKKLILTVFL